MKGSLHLDLASLPEGATDVRLETPGEDLDLGDFVVGVEGPVVCDLIVVRGGSRGHDTFAITGPARAAVRLECSRCLVGFGREIEVMVDVFAEHGAAVPQDDDNFVSLSDLGEGLDLTPVVRELVLLEIPMAPRCREDCKGLCPRCGADLNEAPCACEVETGLGTTLGDMLKRS